MASAVDGPSPDVPHVDEDAERAVLGAILIRGDAAGVKMMRAKGLRPEHFYKPKHADMFAAAISLAERKAPIDQVTLSAELEAIHRQRIPAWEIEEFVSHVPSSGNYAEYGEIVVNTARWRTRQTALAEMAKAVARKDTGPWREAVGRMRAFEEQIRPPVDPATRPRNVRVTIEGNTAIIADLETGEIHKRLPTCEACEHLSVQLAGAERDVRAWRSRFSELERLVKEEDVSQDELYEVGQALFGVWRRMAGRTLQTQFSSERFLMCRPFLRRYGWRRVEQAIAGICFDPLFSEARRNGSRRQVNDWESIFTAGKGKGRAPSTRRFEECCNRAPKGWKPTLQIDIQAAPPQLDLIEGGRA